MNTIILEMQLSRNLCLLKPWALFIIIFLVNANSVNSHDLHHGIHYLVSAPQHISSVNTIPKMYVHYLNASVSNAPEKDSLIDQIFQFSMTIKLAVSLMFWMLPQKIFHFYSKHFMHLKWNSRCESRFS